MTIKMVCLNHIISYPADYILKGSCQLYNTTCFSGWINEIIKWLQIKIFSCKKK